MQKEIFHTYHITKSNSSSNLSSLLGQLHEFLSHPAEMVQLLLGVPVPPRRPAGIRRPALRARGHLLPAPAAGADDVLKLAREDGDLDRVQAHWTLQLLHEVINGFHLHLDGSGDSFYNVGVVLIIRNN